MDSPGWYQRLPRGARDGIDQTLHFLGGFALALVFGDRLFAWWREFVGQAPIERIEDTRRDYFFWALGGTVGHIAQVGAIVAAFVVSA
jgi:adenylosuccinate lyase